MVTASKSCSTTDLSDVCLLLVMFRLLAPFLFSLYIYIYFLTATLVAYGSSQARDRNGATAVANTTVAATLDP